MSHIFYDNVSFSYDEYRPVLQKVSLRIQQGEIVGIMGKNGAGKSTLIHMMNGLLHPNLGSVSINGTATGDYDPSQLTTIVGLMFQNPEHQLFSTTVEDELDFSLKNLKISKEKKNQYKQETIEQLELQNLLKKSPWNCSGGERKKVSLASILCRKPEILVFDEPTLGQDKQGYSILDSVLSNAIKKGKTIIVVTHNTEFAFKHLNRIIVMGDGQILADGPTSKILTNEFILENSSLIEPRFIQFRKKLTDKITPEHKLYSHIQQSQNYEELGMILQDHLRGGKSIQ